ncbi:MAG TPA: hypothetical protein PKL70_17910 [Saprospiraceae bacterium]|nr:hypothetical protein [Saprospiraceae bacterium]
MILLLFLFYFLPWNATGTEMGSIGEPLAFADSGLFDEESILQLTITGAVNKLIQDRSDAAKAHPVTLVYEGPDGPQSLSLKMKTRGNFRRTQGNCTYPPLSMDFTGQPVDKGLFAGKKKLKLVMPCRGEDYVVREYLVYKLHNLFGPKSYKVRMVHIQFREEGNSKKDFSVTGYLLEEDEAMAARNEATLITKRMMRPENTAPRDFVRMALFEYMIGNTDWSVQYLHNVRLLAIPGEKPVPVPYDFDHSGLVDAPYAKPSEALGLRSVTERRYRGYCMADDSLIREVLTEFTSRENEIMATVDRQPWQEKNTPETIKKYLGGFFEIIRNEKKWTEAVRYPCDKNGTGNVVVKGLKE